MSVQGGRTMARIDIKTTKSNEIRNSGHMSKLTSDDRTQELKEELKRIKRNILDLVVVRRKSKSYGTTKTYIKRQKNNIWMKTIRFNE